MVNRYIHFCVECDYMTNVTIMNAAAKIYAKNFLKTFAIVSDYENRYYSLHFDM